MLRAKIVLLCRGALLIENLKPVFESIQNHSKAKSAINV